MTAIHSPVPIDSRTPARAVNNPPKESRPFSSLMQAAVSFGLLPLILWPSRWVDFVEADRQNLQQLIAWWRGRISSAEAGQLDQISARIKPRPMLAVIPWIIICCNIGLMAVLMVQGDSIARIWNLTFKQVHPSTQMQVVAGIWRLALPLEQLLYPFWIVTLCVAFSCHAMSVGYHTTALRGLRRWAVRNNIEPRASSGKSIGLLIVSWIIVAVVFASQHIWWAIPMCIAGAMQTYCVRKCAPQIRMALADPGMSRAQRVSNRICARTQCGARLPKQARFCVRCGTAV